MRLEDVDNSMVDEKGTKLIDEMFKKSRDIKIDEHEEIDEKHMQNTHKNDTPQKSKKTKSKKKDDGIDVIMDALAGTTKKGNKKKRAAGESKVDDHVKRRKFAS